VKPFVLHSLGQKFRDAMRWGKIPRPKGPPDPPPTPPGTAFDFATTLNYPRPFCHGETRGVGWPLLDGNDNRTNTLNTAFIQSYGKFPLCFLGCYPFMQFRQDAALAMYAFNPNLKILWWDTLTQLIEAYGDLESLARTTWENAKAPIDTRFYYPVVGNAQDGQLWPQLDPPNPTIFPWHDQGVCAAGRRTIFDAAGIHTGVGDGFHIDYLNAQMNVQGGVAGGIDLTRTQWSTVPQLNASMDAGAADWITYLNSTRAGKKVCFPNAAILDNSPTIDLFCGRFFEGFISHPWSFGSPSFPWTNFDGMMASPVFNRWQGAGIDGGGTALLMAETTGLGYTAEYNRMARFITALSCLIGGYGCANLNGTGHLPNFGTPPSGSDRWADEFSVTPAGVHDTTNAGCGYLGRPIERQFKDSGGLWVRRFQKGIAIVNPRDQFIPPTGSLSITLEKPYKRIQGLHDTSVNNSATVTSVTIPAHDGRILLTI